MPRLWMLSAVVATLAVGAAAAQKPVPHPATAAKAAPSASPAGPRVQTRGVEAAILIEAPISGPLHDVNNRYKMRVTQVKIAPGGYVAEHTHAGPGIRKVTAGTLTQVGPEGPVTYHAGDYFFLAGDTVHREENKGTEPEVHEIYEILPATFDGPSLLPPAKK